MILERQHAVLFLAPCCAFVLFLFLAPEFFNSEMLQRWWWGGLHLWRFPVLPHAAQLVVPFLPIAIFLLPERVFERRLAALDAWWQTRPAMQPAGVFIALFLVLWIFRSTSLIFGDGEFYVFDLIPGQAFSERGLILMFDSIGATFVYSFGYRFANLWFGLSVLTWYHLVGLASLLVFVAWIWKTRRLGRTLAMPVALAILFAGNWSQATLGPPEHYCQLLLCCLAFAIIGIEVLAGREPTWKACLIYCLGAFFHLGIGWIFPALAYLCIYRWKRDTPFERQLSALCIALPILLTGCLVYWFGFDISFFVQSNAGQGKLIAFYRGPFFQYTTFDVRHLAHILQEIFLMGWPGIILIASIGPFIRWGRFVRDPAAIFLLLFLAGTLVFNLVWNPDLEFWRDQDLFSIVGLAVCLVGVYMLVGPEGRSLSPAFRRRAAAAAIIGGIGWRIPVILYHSVLAMNYGNPESIGTWWPFAVAYRP